jgi:hypothetical protein
MSGYRFFPIAAIGVAVAACSDLGGPTPGPGQGRVVVSMGSTTSGSAGGSASGPAPAAGPMTLGGTVLVFEDVDLVLREIELKRAPDSVPCEDHRGSGRDDECEEIEIGPVLLSLALDGRTEQVITATVDTGTFRRVEFEIHKPDDDSGADRAFLRDHPEFRRVSIRARGTFNGSPFVFTTDVNAEQRFDLVPPLVVREGQTTELVLMVDLRSWFLNATGTAFVNPETANPGGPNENLVKNNIKLSIEMFGRL